MNESTEQANLETQVESNEESTEVTEQPLQDDNTETEVEDEPQQDEDNAESEDDDNTGEEAEEGESSEEKDEKFPKKAERALERRNKKINKLRAENAELERKLQEFTNNQREQQVTNNQTEGLQEPREEDFEDYADYLVEKGKYEVRKEYATKESEAEQHRQFESQQKWVQERAAYVDERAAKAVEAIPELDGMYRENQDIIEGYSDTTKLAFLEADKPELAFYALASEGKLEDLDNMSPTKVAREIALAEIRGEKLTKSRPQSKAPAPINKTKGTSGTRRRTLDDMSPKELIEHLNRKK